MQLPSKFCEDKNGVKFSPIVTSISVKLDDGTSLQDWIDDLDSILDKINGEIL